MNDKTRLTRQNRIAYDRIADRYTQKWFDKPDHELVDRFLVDVAAESRVLDVGCGPGHYARLFLRANIQVTCLDASEGMIAKARPHVCKADFVLADLNNPPFADSSFDAVWACASFPHVPSTNAARVLRELARLTRPEGNLFINAIIGDADNRIESSEEIGFEDGEPGRFFQWYPNDKVVSNLLEENGWRIKDRIVRRVYSDVIPGATEPENLWINYFCQRRHISEGS